MERCEDNSLECKAIPGVCVPGTAFSGLSEPWGWKRIENDKPVVSILRYIGS